MSQLRTRQPEITKAKIIDAAIEAADQLGVGGFTLDAVVSRLSLSKGALLHHYPNKLALLEGMVDHIGQTFLADVRLAAADDPDPYVRLSRAYLRVTINQIGNPDDTSLGRVALIACLIEPSVAERWHANIREIVAEDPTDPAGSDDALMLRLVADGLWLSYVTGGRPIPLEQRQALLHLLDAKPPLTSA